MKRRTFLQQGFIAGATVSNISLFGWHNLAFGQDVASVTPDLVAVRNGEPDVMFDKAIAAVGGMNTFVQQGQIVVVKPNIGWDRKPETGANTNPLLVKRIVEHCLSAGAKKVYVFDHVVNRGAKTYKTSGIEQTAKAGGAIVAPAGSKTYYEPVTIPGAERLKTARVHELLLEADVFINVPVLKHHFSSQATIAMKNLMGVVWDRETYHRQGLHDCIADFCLYRIPDLNIVDAYRVTMANGPQRARESDIALKKMLLLSADIVAIDAAAVKILGKEPQNIRYIRLGHEKKIGTMNLAELNIHKIVL